MFVASTYSKKELSTDVEPDLVIFHANELVTMNTKYGAPRIGEDMSELAAISDGAVAVKDDIIIFIGKTEELMSKYEFRKIPTKIDATNKLVSPGFVDPHTHIIFEGTRENELSMKLEGMSYLDILKSGGGILKTVRETREASIEKLVTNGKKILDKMMSYGTTTLETKSGYGLTTESELKQLRAIEILNEDHPLDIIPTFLGAHAIPPEYNDKSDKYVDLIISDMIPQIVKERLAEFCDVFCEEGIFSIKQARKILKAAIRYGLKPQIHIDEIVDTNGALLASEIRAIHASHLLKSNEKGLKAIAETGVIAILLPSTPFCLMLNEYAPARKMIELEIPIAIATDLNPNCWTESMQMIIALACYNMKLSPAEALTSATINAACALQKQDEIGSLEISKKADILVFDIPNHDFLPYHFGVNLISKVIKNGKIIVDSNLST
ncbi:MAG: imidazolonepropionase [Promethearchaeota archaeon]|nr:MAG: imidazolonepropionase [Candidatus Lokiarchaeota archaeon]